MKPKMPNRKFEFKTPILLIAFNRLNTAKKSFGEIKKVKPRELFIMIDGARENRPGEKEKVDAVKNYIMKNITWKCKVKTLFREKNLGCRKAISSAISWFFENVEQGIIIEDDCIPSQSFFRFCQEMLEKYKNDERIAQICGTNIKTEINMSESYLFSSTFNIWGWATWRRAWKKYDIHMKDWPSLRLKSLSFMRDYSLLDKVKSFRLYDLTYKNKIDTWDYQWDFICKINNFLSVIPQKNLIENIGFSDGAHTANGVSRTIPRKNLKFPLAGNDKKISSREYNKAYSDFFRTPLRKIISNKLRR